MTRAVCSVTLLFAVLKEHVLLYVIFCFFTLYFKTLLTCKSLKALQVCLRLTLLLTQDDRFLKAAIL